MARSSSGFTLIEALVVLVTLGILTTIGISVSNLLLPRLRLDASQETIRRAMRTAQTNARRYSETWQVTITGSPPLSPLVVRTQPAAIATVPTICNFRPCTQDTLDPLINLSLNNFPGGAARFNARGESNLGRFRVQHGTNPADTRCVFLSTLLGAMRLASGASCN